MSMILAVDQMASRYGVLPSVLLREGSTFDLVIMDAALSYQREMEKKQDPGYVPNIPLEDLIKMRDGVG